LSAFSQRIAQPLPPAVVAPLAAGWTSVAPGARKIKEPYFVVLSTIEPRKNHLMLLHLWRRMREELGANTPRLVVIGQRGWECENVVDLLERSEVLRGYVVELSRCDDYDLATYLHHAQALLFPSFVEGYGLPLIEALAAGVPVVASDLPVFREFAADIPEYADPLDPQRWLRLIKAYGESSSVLREAQLERIRTFSLPTWEQHFELLESLLSQLGKQS
ncbi:MAG: glycosyltransferase family 1 protein, partial [Usitatibacteraceae bacterium]